MERFVRGLTCSSQVSRELTSKLEPGHPADGPLPFDSHPDATAICAMSTLVAMSATAMKVPISFYKINYEDKDAWFTSMSGNEDWNNIGQGKHTTHARTHTHLWPRTWKELAAV